MMNIVLLGKASAGRSASGNTILGREKFSSKSIKNQTPVVQDGCVYIDGEALTVYDTPGLFDPETTNEDVMKQWRPLLHLVPSVSTVFLLVMKIDRFTPEEKRTVELIKEFLGDQRLQNTWILFTRGDDLESEGLTIEKCISETEELKRVVQRFNNRYHVFNNVKHDPDQVRRLIKKIGTNQMNSKKMDSEIAKTTQSLTIAEDMRNHTKLIMQPYANWEQYLTPAPLSIAILGQLVFISSQTDFSINKNPPKDGYKHIRYPDSFCACLLQVCNSGWGAFNEAHKNMDQIQLHTMTIPDYMKSAVKILFQGNDEIIQAHLPDQLENIHVIADEWLDLAASTEQRFIDVINIIQELLEACVNAEHFYGEELKEIKRKLSEKAVKRSERETRGFFLMSVYNMEQNQKELTEILTSMRNCEVKQIDFNTTIKMLVKGMDAMGRVKEQWEKMVRFFTMVSNIVKTSLTRTLKNLISTSEKTQSLSYNSKLFSKDLLYNQVFEATNIASLVHMISATYTDVSGKYLMDRVSSLGKLMTMDQEKPEFLQERQQLQNSCDEAQKGILSLVRKNKDEFERKTIARLEKIDSELLAILPKAAPEEMKSIQAAVESGFTEEEEDDYA